jgi:hypothetical protein
MTMPVAAGMTVVRTAIAVVTATASVASSASRGILHARTEIVAHARGGRRLRGCGKFAGGLAVGGFKMLAGFDSFQSIGVSLVGGISVKLVAFAVFFMALVVAAVGGKLFAVDVVMLVFVITFVFAIGGGECFGF